MPMAIKARTLALVFGIIAVIVLLVIAIHAHVKQPTHRDGILLHSSGWHRTICGGGAKSLKSSHGVGASAHSKAVTTGMSSVVLQH